MLHNNAAQQRPGEKLASAPKASQTIPRAQGRAYILIQTLKQRSQHEDTQAASLTVGNMDTHIIHIQGAHSPPPRLDLTTHAKQQTQQQPYGPAEMLGQNSELSPWLARHHPPGEGYGQAHSVLGPEQGTEQGMLPWHATQGLHRKPVLSQHIETPGNTQATATAQYTHSTLLKSSNRPMAAARRRQGQQLYAWHDTPRRRPQAAPPFPLTPAGEAIQLQPPALPPEAWPCECNTNKAKQPKRDQVFLNKTHCRGVWSQSVSAQPKCVGVCLHECVRMCRRVRACAYVHMMGIVRVHACMCHVRMHACTLCGRMLACDCVYVRSAGARAHV